MGTLSLGLRARRRAGRARSARLTESEIAFALDGRRALAATLPADRREPRWPRLAGAPGVSERAPCGDEEYVALSRPLAPEGPGTPAVSPRSSCARARSACASCARIHTALAGTALLAVLVATVLSYAVARTVTRPLATITAAMREMSTTGDLTRKIALEPGPLGGRGRGPPGPHLQHPHRLHRRASSATPPSASGCPPWAGSPPWWPTRCATRS